MLVDAISGRGSSPPFNFSATVNSSVISTECTYDPASSNFYLAANNGTHVFVAVSADPTSNFIGPFTVQADGLDPRNPDQALLGLHDCLADQEGSCQVSKMEVRHPQQHLSWISSGRAHDSIVPCTSWA